VADRDVRRQHLERIVGRAGVPLSADAAWSLLRLDEYPDADPVSMARTYRLDANQIRRGVAELLAARLVERVDDSPEGQGRYRINPGGCDVLERLVAARRQHLAELIGDHPPERQREIAAFLQRIAGELVPEPQTAAQNRLSL